ncbi:MAG TPA: M28 family peptidase [Gemmatimonadales bacterium]|nr:M28 family peptidase [Gemmatimonadales bacterium]
MRRQPLTPFLFLLLVASPLAAQTLRGGAGAPGAEAVRRAVETITEADMRSRIGALAHDSMRGRDTPSPELESAARWIASEFRRFGLRPGGDSGTYLQRYSIRRTVTDSASVVMAVGGGVHGHWRVGHEALLVASLGGDPAPEPVSGPLVLLAGPLDTARPFADLDVRGAVILQVPAPGAVNPRLIERARQAGARGWILVQPVPGPVFARQARRAFEPELQLASAASGAAGIPVFVVRDSTAAPVLRAVGETVEGLRSGPARARQLRDFTGSFTIRRVTLSEITAPNVIGVLEGSDPVLRNEYVVYTAHMDHVGVGNPVNGDSIFNGADDDASGTSGVIELAEAFATLNPRPRRSLIFMLVSGEEKGLWGSRWFSDHPTVPIENIVANINLDMIGRNWRDTVSVIGKEHSSLGEVANRVARAHPELNMALVDDLWPRENFYFRSDHYNFARRGVPILFFFNGTHADYHRVTDTVDRIDAEKAARIVRMVFYVGLEVAQADQRPQWDPASRQRIVEGAGNE